MPNNENVKIVQFGLGPIGLEIVKNMVKVHKLDVIGAVDIDPEKVGKDPGELAGTDALGIKVVPALEKMDNINSLGDSENKVAIHTTGSNLEKVWPQIKELLDYGFSVVSTCEELSFPWDRYPELSDEINNYAANKGLAVLGTGVNPGFIMDTAVLCFTSVLNEVQNIKVVRKVDVSKRRVPLQRKVGAGMSSTQFEELAEKGQIGHVGLEESARLIASGLNIKPGRVTNSIKPVIADKDMDLALGKVKKGEVCGQHQVVKAEGGGGKTIILELVMAAGVNQEDRIIAEGEEKIEVVVPNGIFGDTATAAMAINMAKLLGTGRSTGLLTMGDIQLPRNLQFSHNVIGSL